ncbi:MAG: hypothetical protein HFJ32_03050 [Clostridia bacterium]|nr:hypothetical protein [Clostridia bacterium]
MESNQVKKRKRRIVIAVLICVFLLLGNVATILAANDENLLVPTDDQYLELKAVQVKDVTGQNKQVIMQLWGHNLEFRRI